jgi:hypothetical protein
MGLDVYLKHVLNKSKADTIDQAMDEEINAVFADKSLSQDEQWAKIKKIEARVAASRPPDTIITKIENDSRYPEHLFKIGYFRSSYNPGGINSVMERLALPTLYDIFDPGDEYEFVPDWDTSLARTEDAIAQLKAHMESDMSRFDVEILRPTVVDPQIHNEEEALALFKKHMGRHRKGEGNYASGEGDFYLDDGLKVFALLHGKEPISGGHALYMIFERDDLTWYLQAFEIVRDTIQFVQAQPDSHNYFLAWSS